jgi:hypothetical protein
MPGDFRCLSYFFKQTIHAQAVYKIVQASSIANREIFQIRATLKNHPNEGHRLKTLEKQEI